MNHEFIIISEALNERVNKQANEYIFWNYYYSSNIWSSVNDIGLMLLIESTLYLILYAKSLVIVHVSAYILHMLRADGYQTQNQSGKNREIKWISYS